MIWDLIAAIFAGLGAAGIALGLRFITAKRFPAWTIPAFAGIGMLAFQIYRDYTWISHQQSLLPERVQVVKTIAQSTFWRPWTFIFPETIRFIAMDIQRDATNNINPDLILAEVFLFERRQPARRVHQVFHCGHGARADFTSDLHIPAPGEQLNQQWLTLETDDPLLLAACAQRD